jgi:ribonuclease HII
VSAVSALHVTPTLALETTLFDAGAQFVVGFDEVGRGALAGPVRVGAAVVQRDHIDAIPTGLADSKMLTEKRREALFEPLQQWVAAWGVGEATNKEIDAWGISHALGIAALRALESAESGLGIAAGQKMLKMHSVQDAQGVQNARRMAPAISGILDGPNDYISKCVSTFDAPVISLVPRMVTQVKADQSCASVAAASVLAKVTRDRLMVQLGAMPEYADFGWAKNKGYGSQAHRDAIKAKGPSDLHRISWHLV